MFEMKTRYTGIIPPLITPLTKDRTLDEEALFRLVDYVIEGGVSGIFAMGSSGEAMMTTKSVWRDTLKACLRAAGDRCKVFCGVIDTSTVRVIENIKTAEDLGASIFVVTPCFYLQTSCQDEIIRHYEKAAASTKGSIVVYNIPGMTHVNIEPETIRRIAEIDNVVAMKDSSADWERFQRFLFMLQDRDIALFNGAEELCAAAMVFGAQGCVPGLANFFPKMFVDMADAAKKGDIGRATELQRDCWEVRKSLMVGKHWMSAMKYIGSRMGFGENISSDPIEPLTEEQMRQIDRIIEKYM